MSSRPSRGAARLAAILNALPDALLLVNANGTIVNANSIALETLEAPGTALVGRGLLDLLPGFDSKRIPGSMRRPDPEEGPRTRPTRMIARRTDGSEFPVEVTSANLEDARTPYADGHTQYTGDELLMLVVRDLTGTLDTETELARQQRQTEMILRAASEGVVGVDIEGKVVLVNPAAAQILGFRASDLGGQSLHPLVHHSRPDGSPLPYDETPLADTLRSGRKHRVRGQALWTKEGRAVPVDLTTAPVREGEVLVGAVMTFTDRSRLNALAGRNAQLRALLDSSLRAPLNELRSELAGLIDDPAVQLWPEANQILHHLAAGSARMTTLIGNVLSYQRLETGKERLDRRPERLDEIVSAGVEGAAELIGPGRGQFAVHASQTMLLADGPRMAQALSHLVVDVSGVDSAGRTAVASGDSTIVVAASQQDDVARFEVRGPHPGGSPVHLPIARGIVERHGGTLRTEESDGQGGGAYVFELPIGDVGDAEDDDEDPGRSGDTGTLGGGIPGAGGREHDSGMTVMPKSLDPVRGTRSGAPGSHGIGPTINAVAAGRPPRQRQPVDDSTGAPRAKANAPGAALALPAGTGGGTEPTGRRRALHPTEPGAIALPAAPRSGTGPRPGTDPRSGGGPRSDGERRPNGERRGEARAIESGAPPRPPRPPGGQPQGGAPGSGFQNLGTPAQSHGDGQAVPTTGRRARRALADGQQPEPSAQRPANALPALPALPPGRGTGRDGVQNAGGPSGPQTAGAMPERRSALPGGQQRPPVPEPLPEQMPGADAEGQRPQGRRARREDWPGPQQGPQHEPGPIGPYAGAPGAPGALGAPGAPGDTHPGAHDGGGAYAGGTQGGRHGAAPQGGPTAAEPPPAVAQGGGAEPTGRRAKRPANGPDHPGAMPPAIGPGGTGQYDTNGQAISVRTLGQGVAYTAQGGPTSQETMTLRQAGHAQQQHPQQHPQQGAPSGGSGRRRRLASPQLPAGPGAGPATGGGARPHPVDATDAHRTGTAYPAGPANPAFRPSDTRDHGQMFTIGAPAEGAEGPEMLDGPGGAVEVTGAAQAGMPGTGPQFEPDAGPMAEGLAGPRRLLVWPEPDVSTRQALTDRGYRPVTVRSREDVDAQVAEYPAALFVDPLTGPITRTALQSLRAAAVAAEVPVLVTAGLGQATREAAYGADPAVLLKALAPRDSEQHPPRVLLVEAHHEIAAAFTATLERRGMQVAHAASESDAADLAARIRPNLVVMNLLLIRRRRAGIIDWLGANGLLNRTPLVVYTSVDIEAAELPRLGSGETVLFLAERSTNPEVQGRIVDLLSKIGAEP